MDKQTIQNIIKFLDRAEVKGIQEVEAFQKAVNELRKEYDGQIEEE